VKSIFVLNFLVLVLGRLIWHYGSRFLYKPRVVEAACSQRQFCGLSGRRITAQDCCEAALKFLVGVPGIFVDFGVYFWKGFHGQWCRLGLGCHFEYLHAKERKSSVLMLNLVSISPLYPVCSVAGGRDEDECRVNKSPLWVWQAIVAWPLPL
jgi:hypothetical protein